MVNAALEGGQSPAVIHSFLGIVVHNHTDPILSVTTICHFHPRGGLLQGNMLLRRSLLQDPIQHRGLTIMLTIFALNLFGDGLRDALDPRLKR